MRALVEPPETTETVMLAATDPANPFGTMLKWPAAPGGDPGAGRGPTRTVGSVVFLVNGALAAYMSRGARQFLVYLPEDEPSRAAVGRALAARLAQLARPDEGGPGLLVAEINGVPAADHPFAPFLVEAGFNPSAMGFQRRRQTAPLPTSGRAEPEVAGRAGRHA
jgi:ATP-dependent Lhr-like helicase